MSKKNKQKFKKQLKAQALSQMTQNLPETKTAQSSDPKPTVQAAHTPAKAKNEPLISEIQNLPQIKADLVKTAIVVGSFAIIIAAVIITDSRYHMLSNFGNLLFRVLHLQ